MTRARTRLLLDYPWFGSLAMRLRFEAKPDVQTMATDGTTLFYAPDFVATLPDAELVGVMAHEVMHCALLHPFRRGSRDLAEWNQATDYAINGELFKAGFKLPADVLHDAQYDGLSADVIFSQRAKAKQDKQDASGQPQNGQGNTPAPAPTLSTGTVQDAPKPGSGDAGKGSGTQPGKGDAPAPQGMTESDWQIATEQASAVGKAAGCLPGDAARAAKAARDSREDWRAVLREFVEHTQPSDYSWSTPNRRHIASGLYLPGLTRENLGVLTIAVDTSGSINQRLLDLFASEVSAIVHEARPERVDVIYCDSRVRHCESFSPDDSEVKLSAHGGGGTRFSPVFNHIAEQPEQPAALLYFTDLDCYDKPAEPAYPVLWVTGLHVTRKAPFGRTARIDFE
jgi:predicted metal-dependent peptidase